MNLKPISKYGIMVSDDGRVFKNGRELAQNKMKGYLRVKLCNDGKKLIRGVHALVLEAFVGPKTENQMTRHLDGTRDNNRLENLCWGTNRENVADRIRHGVPVGTRGEDHPKAKITERDVVEIRSSDESDPELAKRFGISTAHVCGIRRGYYWKNAPFPKGRPASLPRSACRDYVPPCRRILAGAIASDGPPKPP